MRYLILCAALLIGCEDTAVTSLGEVDVVAYETDTRQNDAEVTATISLPSADTPYFVETCVLYEDTTDYKCYALETHEVWRHPGSNELHISMPPPPIPVGFQEYLKISWLE